MANGGHPKPSPKPAGQKPGTAKPKPKPTGKG